MKKILQVLLNVTVTAFLFLMFSSYSAENTALAWQLKTQSGDVISLSDYKNKPVILHFWATWCPYCKKVQPKLVELQKKYQQQDVELIAISFNEDEGALPQDVLTQRGYSFSTAVHGDRIAQLYGVRGTPTTFFLNKNHQIIFKSTSSDVTDPRLELAVKEIIKK